MAGDARRHSGFMAGDARRRATAYLAVVGTSVVVALIGLAALTTVRIEARSLQGGGDLMEAMHYAQSAIEMGRYKIRNDPNWRTNLTNGTWIHEKPIGSGLYSLEGLDPIDGIIANILDHPLTLIGTGIKGDARYKLQVRLQSKGGALTCLQVPQHSGSNTTMSGATVSATGGPVSSNGSVSVSSSNVGANVEAVGSITGSYYWGTKTSSISPRTMPETSVFDYYIANGTPINIASIPKANGVPTIQDVTLSNLTNPYGGTNLQGIYVISCAGSNLRIRNSAIVGTLVVLDPGEFSIQNGINWIPAVPNYPALLVRGNVQLAYTKLDFALNLVTIPSLVTGLIYASNDVSTSASVTVTGALIAGRNISNTGALTLTYDPTLLLAPPPGFSGESGDIEVVPGSWKRVVDAIELFVEVPDL